MNVNNATIINALDPSRLNCDTTSGRNTTSMLEELFWLSATDLLQNGALLREEDDRRHLLLNSTPQLRNGLGFRALELQLRSSAPRFLAKPTLTKDDTTRIQETAAEQGASSTTGGVSLKRGLPSTADNGDIVSHTPPQSILVPPQVFPFNEAPLVDNGQIKEAVVMEAPGRDAALPSKVPADPVNVEDVSAAPRTSPRTEQPDPVPSRSAGDDVRQPETIGPAPRPAVVLAKSTVSVARVSSPAPDTIAQGKSAGRCTSDRETEVTNTAPLTSVSTPKHTEPTSASGPEHMSSVLPPPAPLPRPQPRPRRLKPLGDKSARSAISEATDASLSEKHAETTDILSLPGVSKSVAPAIRPLPPPQPSADPLNSVGDKPMEPFTPKETPSDGPMTPAGDHNQYSERSANKPVTFTGDNPHPEFKDKSQERSAATPPLYSDIVAGRNSHSTLHPLPIVSNLVPPGQSSGSSSSRPPAKPAASSTAAIQRVGGGKKESGQVVPPGPSSGPSLSRPPAKSAASSTAATDRVGGGEKRSEQVVPSGQSSGSGSSHPPAQPDVSSTPATDRVGGGEKRKGPAVPSRDPTSVSISGKVSPKRTPSTRQPTVAVTLGIKDHQSTDVRTVPRQDAPSPTAVPQTSEPKFTYEQKAVIQRVLAGENVFFTGPAGCGKSLLLKHLITLMQERYSPDEVAVTASTGIAAVPLGGCTLHSFTGIGWGEGLAHDIYGKVLRRPYRVKEIRCKKVLFIEELSMISAGIFGLSNYVTSAVRGRMNAPFGGMQVIATGDFFQLPPVGKGFKESYAFESRDWTEVFLPENCIRLTYVFRQREPTFLTILQHMRMGEIEDKPARLWIIRAGLLDRKIYPDGIPPLEIYNTKAATFRANMEYIDNLPGERVVFKAKDTCTVRYDIEAQQALFEDFMAPPRLYLKVRTPVMLVINYPHDREMVNGTRGIVLAFMSETEWNRRGCVFREGQASDPPDGEEDKEERLPLVKFLVSGSGKVRVELVHRHIFRNTDAKGTATRDQVCLIPAFALTTHKAQGIQSDRVRYDMTGAKEDGQAYTACSRATSRSGLEIANFKASGFKTSQDVKKFDRTLTVIPRPTP